MDNIKHKRKEKRQNPFLFQGDKKTKGYFEGWYYKQVNTSRQQTLSVIFGVSLNVEHAHAFIQLLLTKPLRTFYFEFPVSAFREEGESFLINTNQFSAHHLILDLHQEHFDCVGRLDFGPSTPLKASLYMPSIMGPFAYIPDMECNHGIVSMRHTVGGELMLDGEIWEFEDDIGYIEKDWGRSFPKRYIWIQGNHFILSEANLMLSMADIPMFGWTFEGIIAQLDIPGLSIRIASYLGARKIALQRTESGFMVELLQGQYRLIVHAATDETGVLKAPILGSMHATIKEGLGGTISVRLLKAGKIIWEDVSKHCGIEIEGYDK